MSRIAENRDADAAWMVQIARDWLERAEGRAPLLDHDVPCNAEATRRAIRNFLPKDAETEEVTVEEGDTHEAAIAAARELYADDDLEIDADPAISEAEEGTWVAAWVWVGRDRYASHDGDAQ